MRREGRKNYLLDGSRNLLGCLVDGVLQALAGLVDSFLNLLCKNWTDALYHPLLQASGIDKCSLVTSCLRGFRLLSGGL